MNRSCRWPTSWTLKRARSRAELVEESPNFGYFGILIPEEFGGLGLGAFVCLVAEDSSRGWMSIAA